MDSSQDSIGEWWLGGKADCFRIGNVGGTVYQQQRKRGNQYERAGVVCTELP
ncbi:MAG: hypothetical protein WCC99_03145 [Candidatus Sulfotelmatobacter sp.]